MTTPEQEQEPTEQAKALHGEKANPEVFEQPGDGDVIELDPSATVVATEPAPDPFDGRRHDDERNDA